MILYAQQRVRRQLAWMYAWIVFGAASFVAMFAMANRGRDALTIAFAALTLLSLLAANQRSSCAARMRVANTIVDALASGQRRASTPTDDTEA